MNCLDTSFPELPTLGKEKMPEDDKQVEGCKVAKSIAPVAAPEVSSSPRLDAALRPRRTSKSGDKTISFQDAEALMHKSAVMNGNVDMLHVRSAINEAVAQQMAHCVKSEAPTQISTDRLSSPTKAVEESSQQLAVLVSKGMQQSAMEIAMKVAEHIGTIAEKMTKLELQCDRLQGHFETLRRHAEKEMSSLETQLERAE